MSSDPRHLLTLAPAFLRPSLVALLDRLDRVEMKLADVHRQLEALKKKAPHHD